MFSGGVHVLDFKQLSKDQNIEEFPAPSRVFIPLSQHTGSPAKPVVQKGDIVAEGQIIGEATGFISTCFHSSISGKVAGIESAYLPSGKRVPSVVIENDGQNRKTEPVPRDWLSLKAEEIISLVKNAGIVGMGGAAFPTHVKLSLPPGRTAETVILNACECEPFLTCDYRVLRENAGKVLEGLQIICKTVGVEKACIGMEANKKDLIGILQPLLNQTRIPLKINLHILAEKYPQGSEKQLIQAITGREVPSGKLPIDIRCLVFNVQTSLAIRQAVCEGTPLTDRVLTVAGLVEKPKNLAVRVGTSVSEILTHCGGELNPGRKLVIGGPMMGVQVPNADLPVLKGTSGILILPQEELPEEIEPCIRCGKCIEVCPMRLVPTEIGRNARLGNWEGCRRFNVTDCMECGCCGYICPAKIPLVELFKWAKVEIRRKQ